jgi:putative Mg2+ transporter-C (MgtC) family protein
MSVIYDLVLPLGGAAVAGLLIGAEREYRGQAAGLRTHALLCVGCALLMLLSGKGVAWVGPRAGLDLNIDPARALQGMLAGIGFLCGGVIFRSGVSIHGLTTAASMWCVTVLGVAFGAERYGVGIIGTVLLLVLLSAAKWVDAHMPKTVVAKLAVRFRLDQAPDAPGFRALLHDKGLRCEHVSQVLFDQPPAMEFATTIRGKTVAAIDGLNAALVADPRVLGFKADLRHG